MSAPTEEKKELSEAKRIKKNKYAVVLGYCGTGYYGLQRNPGIPTIEEEFLKACLTKEFISKCEYDNLGELKFQRAARTDKGVSAAVQVLSLNLPAERVESLAHELNPILPSQIHVYGSIRATKYFDAKNYCCGRTYSYLLPTFAIAPPDVTTDESYRAPKQVIDEFSKVLSYYRGTHNFHNFTSGKESTDTSAMRYILSIECGQPFEKDGIEFVVIRLRGQSFMIHQIRKMVGMAIAVMKGFASLKSLEKSFSIEKMDVPRAPGLGLMLENIHYDKYNSKFGGNGIHEPLSWSRWAEEIANFKETKIYPIMVDTEKNEKSMLTWLPCLALHSYEFRAQGEKTPLGDALYKVSPAKYYQSVEAKNPDIKQTLEENKNENEDAVDQETLDADELVDANIESDEPESKRLRVKS